MKDLSGSVAVITGGASGIGFALAKGAQQRGAKLVISDIRNDALSEAETQLSANGPVLAVQADVSRYEDVERLADETIAKFGKANLLFNNAGIFASGLTWDVSLDEYDWVMGVNQKSVIHGIKAFVPRMIAQGDPCHVTTISSGAGITVNTGFCSYSMTKHAVLALTEALYLDLATQGIENIGVTITMPGVVQSQIMFPEKTGLASLQDELKSRHDNPILNAVEAAMRDGVDNGLPADDLADLVYAAIANGDLYVLPNFTDERSQMQAGAIAMGRAKGSNPYPAMLQAMLDDLSNGAE